MATPSLFYDGPCHLCQRAIQWVHRHVPGVACMPMQSDEAKKTLPTTLVTPPRTGVVLVDAEGEVHVGHQALHALCHSPRSVALDAASRAELGICRGGQKPLGLGA